MPADRNPEFYLATGYRVSKSRSNSKRHSTRLDRYPTMELDAEKYEALELSREMHIVLAHEDQALVGGIGKRLRRYAASAEAPYFA